jgi:nitrite reductase/ring-hydroxylating ferredoxin subunit
MTTEAGTRSGRTGAVRLGPAAEIPVGEGRAYAVAGDQVAVFRPRADAFRAISAICPHAGGPLADGQIDDQVVICPLHMHVFELDTGCSKTGQPDLTSYPVEVDADGFIVVQLTIP